MTDAPRTVSQALAYAKDQRDHETYDWTGYCQKFVRSCYGLPGMFGSAWAQWLGADPEDRHVGGNILDAPVGAGLCFKGSGPYGHIMLAARNDGAWSNDLVTAGDINFVDRDRPTTKWGQEYLGWLSAINNYDLDLRTGKEPKPRQTKHYASVAKAINNMETAVENAVKRGDHKDARVLRAEMRDLKELYSLLRHS